MKYFTDGDQIVITDERLSTDAESGGLAESSELSR